MITLTIPYPNKAHLFLAIDIYRWRIVEEFALAAYYMDRFKESYLAYKKLITLTDIGQDNIDRIKSGYNFALDQFNKIKHDLPHST